MGSKSGCIEFLYPASVGSKDKKTENQTEPGRMWTFILGGKRILEKDKPRFFSLTLTGSDIHFIDRIWKSSNHNKIPRTPFSIYLRGTIALYRSSGDPKPCMYPLSTESVF